MGGLKFLNEVTSNKFSYKVTLNHVNLSSLGKVFDYWIAHLDYELLICGYEKGAKQGTPHYQVYVQHTNIDNYEDMRKLLCEELYEVGVIDEKMTCVAFPLDDPSASTSHHIIEYVQKDGHYIKHTRPLGADYGTVECRWDNTLAEWNEGFWFYKVFDHYRENCTSYPNYIHRVRTWG